MTWLSILGAILIGAAITAFVVLAASFIIALVPVLMFLALFVGAVIAGFVLIKVIQALRELEKDSSDWEPEE